MIRTGTKKHGIRLCDLCDKKDENTMICKSTAKSEYSLNDGDLDDLDYTPVNNPHYRSASEMILYNKLDIKNKFCEKYKITWDKIDLKIAELKLLKLDKKTIRVKKREEKTQSNREKLINALSDHGLELRTDSKLCQQYIDGELTEWTLEAVVQRMCQMKYLYDYCDMDQAYQEAREKQIEELNAGYFPDCSIFDQAEMIALEKVQGKYPEEWPWIQ